MSFHRNPGTIHSNTATHSSQDTRLFAACWHLVAEALVEQILPGYYDPTQAGLQSLQHWYWFSLVLIQKWLQN